MVLLPGTLLPTVDLEKNHRGTVTDRQRSPVYRTLQQSSFVYYAMGSMQPVTWVPLRNDLELGEIVIVGH